MALLGSSIDPKLFIQDYSNASRAAEMRAKTISDIGGRIVGGIEKYGEMKQERKKLEAGTKAAVTGIESAIKMGESLGIDVKSSLTPYLDKINDPNVSPIEAAAYAQQASNSIANVLSLGMKVNEMGVEKARYAQTAAARIAELQAEANKPTKLKSEKAIVGGLEVPTLMDDFGNYYDPSTKLKIIDLQGYAKGLPAERVLEQGGAFVAPAMPMGSTQAVDAGMVLPELQRNVPTLSKEAQATIDAATAGYIDGMPTVGLPIAQDQSQSVQAGLDVTPPAVPDDSRLEPRGTPIGKESKGEVVTQEEANRRTASGLSVTAIPIGGGKVRITSQTGSPKPSPVIESPESKLQTQRLLKLDESLGALREAGTTASLDIEPLKEVTKLLDEGVKTGFGRETLMQAKKILGQDVSNEEQFQARVGAEAMKNIALTKGAISDREMDYFKTVLSPNMGKTTEGNKKIIEFRVKYAKRANKISEMISNLQEQGKNPFEIKKAVDQLISSESLLDSGVTEKTRETPVKKTETELLREELGK